jgi:ankyrin repeat protein
VDNVAYLLQKKAKVDQPNKFGMTALHYAVKNSCVRNSFLLMEYGANPDLQDKKGVSPRHLGKSSTNEDIQEVFRFIEHEVIILFHLN